MGLSKRVVFVADRMEPRLGMPKAIETLLELLPHDRVELVVISGPPPAKAAYSVTTLGQPRGWRGRLLAMRKLRRIAEARSEAGAVIVAAGSYVFIALAAATVFSNFSLTLWEHSMLPWRIRNEWRIAVVAAAVRLLAFRLERVVCVSESNCATVARIVWPLKKLTVIPNVGVATVDQKSATRLESDSHGAVRLVGLGALTRGKNWALAVRAMQHLPQNYTLEIAGGGKQHERLSTLIEELGLTGRVRLLGYVPDADHLMSGADIVLHPSFAETFGYAMIEAAARCRPVVVLDMPAMNEMVPSFACGERAGPTPTGFAEAIVRARGATYDYSETARAREQHFNDDSILNSWTALIADLKR
jgi:glycosyltransferase involved in cell wall biosynthesis